MNKKIFFCLFGVLIAASTLFFPKSAKAIRPNIDLDVSSAIVRPGEPVIFNITVRSNYRLRGNSVEINWGDGLSQNVACVMPQDYDAPPQECSFSVQHIYTAEGDYFTQTSACSDEALPECDIVSQTIQVSGAAIATSYDNPLLAEDIPQFVRQAIVFLFTASLYIVPLMIIIGAYVMVTSGGIPSRIDRGKKIVIWTLIAFAIILISRGLIQLVWMLLGG